MTGRTVSNQLPRSATSVAANYRAACRGRSKKEFFSKLVIVVDEADETAFWLVMIIEGELLSAKRVEPLLREALKITAIMVSSRITAGKTES